jgi:predicted enzyme related to lactoylglutathione lyase
VDAQSGCVQFYVPDLAAGIAFYSEQLGHEVIWRTETSAGLKLPETDTEIVLQTERIGVEVDMLVKSVDAMISEFVSVGGKIVVPPFDIQIGRCAVVEDPWDNRFVLLDGTKGMLETDEHKNVIGIVKPPKSE